MRNLSKSKLVAFRQCPKRLWLTVHRPELIENSAATEAKFRTGYEVGDIAQRLYDPKGNGAVIDAQTEGFGPAFERSRALLESDMPIFEAGFSSDGALAFADVMLPLTNGKKKTWRMIEVKSSTSVKDYHLDDIAIQAFVARSAGVDLSAIALAHIDSSWTYPGDDQYTGLLTEQDLTDATFSRHEEVKGWVSEAQSIVAKKSEPKRTTGHHCFEPFECGFLAYCQAQEPQPKIPATLLPNIASKALKASIEVDGIKELADIPDALLNERQLRVKHHTLANKIYFDKKGAKADLADLKLPATFLDFETINLAIPVWKGTRPYQQIPFQFSVHRISRAGELSQEAFLDLSGNDPSRPFADTLIKACGKQGPVFVYNAGFETARIKELALRFPDLAESLLAINARVFDLLVVARERFYCPSQQGSWSIKAVLPAIAPDLRYDALDGVQDGGLAMEAFREAISIDTTPERKAKIQKQLLAYCRLDTYAMVRLWAFFTGTKAPKD